MDIHARVCPPIGGQAEEYLDHVIRYEGHPGTVVWKYPEENFPYGTYLIVQESQEAVFLRDGQIADVFGPGRYLLEIEEVPQPELYGEISKEIEGTFRSKVYFINRLQHLSVRWGTPEKVRFLDPMTCVPLEVGLSGEIVVTATDSRKLITNIVGTSQGLVWTEEMGEISSFQVLLRSLIANVIKINLPSIIRNEQIDILVIDEKLGLISDILKSRISEELEDYGLTALKLLVNRVVFPEEDPNFQEVRKLHTIALQTKMLQAENTINTTKVGNDITKRALEEKGRAIVEAARREAEVQTQITQTEIARYEAERRMIAAKAEAEEKQLQKRHWFSK